MEQLDISGISIVRIAGNRLAERWQNWDMRGLSQLVYKAKPAQVSPWSEDWRWRPSSQVTGRTFTAGALLSRRLVQLANAHRRPILWLGLRGALAATLTVTISTPALRR